VPDPDADARQPGVAGVLLVAGAVVAVVLGAAALTDLLPEALRDVVFNTPLLIGVLIGGTTLVLWRILRPPRTGGGR
jgi:hypothetical protein